MLGVLLLLGGGGGGRTTDGVTVLVSTYGRNKKRIWT